MTGKVPSAAEKVGVRLFGLSDTLLGKEAPMSEKVYKKVRVVGCSEVSMEKAVELAISKAGDSLHGIAWFEVVEFRGAVPKGKPLEWQATVDVAFKLD